MFEAGNIREWRGHDVVDAQGHKIGELAAVYVDTVSDLPSFGTVTVGKPTRHRLPAGDDEAVFKHYGLAYEPGASGERRLGRR